MLLTRFNITAMFNVQDNNVATISTNTFLSRYSIINISSEFSSNPNQRHLIHLMKVLLREDCMQVFDKSQS